MVLVTDSVEWAVAGRPLPGLELSGDAYRVVVSGDRLFVAVIDGLGHGPEAFEASRIVGDAFATSTEPGLVARITACHAAAQGTRGAVMSVAAFEPGGGTLCWSGVGNVEGAVFRGAVGAALARERLLLAGGVVGYRLPRLRESRVRIWPGDIVVLATDGLESEFASDAALRVPGADVARVAHGLLQRHARPGDDALVWIGRYRGS